MIKDFLLIKVLGRGAFGKVMLCQKQDTKRLYAIKSIRKEDVIEKEQIQHTIAERKIMEQIDHPFLISLEYAFQTKEKLFFVMDFERGGEMFNLLKKEKKFNESRAKFYIGQIVLALEYLHSKSIIYRDLKPENILVSEDGYVKLTDFGLAKIMNKNQLTKSFVGTPEYLAPEVIKCEGHSYPADWWSLGILLYEMIVGIPPFYHHNQSVMFQLIVERDLKFPQTTPISDNGKDLISKLLTKN